jgi:hypothetical protein
MTTISRALAVAAWAAAVTACSGENRFTAPAAGGAERPEVLTVRAPQSITPTDVLRVGVVARSAEGLASLDIVLGGGLIRDTTRLFDPPRLDLDADTDFEIPGTVLPGSIIRVTVTVIDRFGESSDAAEAEVRVVEDDDGT